MKTLTTSDSKHELIESWQLANEGEKLYPADDVIAAYFKGKSDGKSDIQALVRNQFDGNLKKAGEHTHLVIDFLKNLGIKILTAHLKPESYRDFCILFTISDEDFLKDEFMSVYDFTEDIETKETNELYDINFSFINQSKDFDEKEINSDGYFFTFKNKE